MLQKHSYVAILWFILNMTIDVVNNILIKKLGLLLPSYEMTFLSFCFSGIMLLPFMIYYQSFRTNYNLVHIMRGALLSSGLIIKCICLQCMSIVNMALIGFISPILFLLLACFFLSEKVTNKAWAMSFIGFVGTVIILRPTDIDFGSLTLLLLFSCLLLSGLDIINKKYISHESTIKMTFYLAVYTALFSILPILYFGWTKVSYDALILCAALGLGSNIMAFSILKSFNLEDASALMPLRYIYLPISALFGYLIFGEIPNNSSYLGALLIFLGDFFLMH